MTTDKKPTKPESKLNIKPNVKVVKESKEVRFSRLAKVRTEKVLRALRILGNCSNRSNYDYTEAQINKIGSELGLALDSTMAKFTKSKIEIESFNF